MEGTPGVGVNSLVLHPVLPTGGSPALEKAFRQRDNRYGSWNKAGKWWSLREVGTASVKTDITSRPVESVNLNNSPIS